MSDYKITGFQNGQVFMLVDGETVTQPIPVVDGAYVSGQALLDLLDSYTAQIRERINNRKQAIAILPVNSAEIEAMIVPSNIPMPFVVTPQLRQIRQLEMTQHRAVRDFILTGNSTRIKVIEDQISAIRNVI